MKTLHLKLIDGTFTAQEAREILAKIYTDKIHFHEMRNFSSLERFGKVDLHSTMRIKELHMTKELINRELGAMRPEQMVQINSTIQVERNGTEARQKAQSSSGSK